MLSNIYRIYLFFFLIFSLNSNVGGQKLSECILENALQFIGTPYVAGTLDNDTTEKLICRSDAFDCVTFVDYVLGLSLYQIGLKDWNKSPQDNIQKLRYRAGVIDGYGSRLHYFSEWITQNTQWNFLIEVTHQLKGEKVLKNINFITTRPQSYPLLISTKDKIKVAQSEQLLSKSTTFFIPKNKVNAIQAQLLNGDIIAITTDIKGLDIVHTGFIKVVDGQAFLLHASQSSRSVEISSVSLGEYLANNPKQNGIRVIRPFL